MVYSAVNIILGIVLTEDELKIIINRYNGINKECATEEIKYNTGSIEPDIGLVLNRSIFQDEKCGNIGIFKTSRHDNGVIHYMVGINVHKYNRIYDKCKNCDEYSSCVGMTTNGLYDVRAIVDSPVQVNPSHVCLRCFADNRRDITGGVQCSKCQFILKNQYYPDNLLHRIHEYKNIKEFLTKYNCIDNKPIKFYYLLDDCICCA